MALLYPLSYASTYVLERINIVLSIPILLGNPVRLRYFTSLLCSVLGVQKQVTLMCTIKNRKAAP